MKQYNNQYKNVIYQNKHFRVYDELTTNSYTALYSETQIKLIEMIEKYNFKIFYINCESKSNIPITFEEFEHVNLDDKNVINIKKLKSEDVSYFYKNCLFEIIYIIPKLNDNNNYYFNILIVVNEQLNINDLFNHNFNLIKINNISQINIVDISYEWVEKILNNRNIFNNEASFKDQNYIDNYYNLSKIDLSHEDFIKNYNHGNCDYALDQFHNASSPIYYKNLDQNLYFKNCSMLLDLQIWSFDRKYAKIKNDYGFRVGYINFYNVNSDFLTNFAELVGCVSVNKIEKIFQLLNEEFTYCSLADNFYDQCIIYGTLNKFSVKTGFADLSNLIELSEWETKV